MMSQDTPPVVEVEQLAAVSAALQNGADIETALDQADAAPGDDAAWREFAELIQALQSALTAREPQPEFAAALRADLQAAQRDPVSRLRQMSARVSLAAVLAVCAGCLLFVLRRLLGSGAAQDIQDMQEEALPNPL